MANIVSTGSPIVRVNLSTETREIVYLTMISLVGEYGKRNVALSNDGLSIRVQLPPDPRLAQIHFMVDAVVSSVVIPREHDRGA